MSYRGITKHFKIPYMRRGDVMMEEDNRIQMSMIDTLLYISLYGFTNAILHEGAFTTEFEADGNSSNSLLITPRSENGVALAGIIDFNVFIWHGQMRIPIYGLGLPSYVYIETDDYGNAPATNFSEDANFCTVVAENEPLDYQASSLMPLCFIGRDGSIDQSPPGKTVISTFMKHAVRDVNPHGRRLEQADLEVTGSLTKRGFRVPAVQFLDVDLPGGGEHVEVRADPDPYTGKEPPVLFVTAYSPAGEVGWEPKADGSVSVWCSGGPAKAMLRLDIGDAR